MLPPGHNEIAKHGKESLPAGQEASLENWREVDPGPGFPVYEDGSRHHRGLQALPGGKTLLLFRKQIHFLWHFEKHKNEAIKSNQ